MTGTGTYDDNEPSDGSDLCELILIVRPEDKPAVLRALDGELGSSFVIQHALGRGFDGGLLYGRQSPKRNLLSWFRRAQTLAFLPKIMFWTVLYRIDAKRVLERVGTAVRLTGGPSECAGGFAIIAPLCQEEPIGATRPMSAAIANLPCARTSAESALQEAVR